MKKLIKDPLVVFLAVAMLLLLLIQPQKLADLSHFIHWPTITTLIVLLIITTGIKKSRLMERLAGHLIRAVHSKRATWMLLLLFSAFSAMFLTNDIALFLIIPFTLQLNERVSLNIRPLLIFETIAVNVGSMLTPIGNPQNIYLWQKANVSFLSFSTAMFFPFLIQLGLLLAAVYFIADKEIIEPVYVNSVKEVDYKLALYAPGLLVGYLIADYLGAGLYAAGFTVLTFVLFYRSVFRSIDWSLIIIFLLLFIDMGIISKLPFLESLNNSLDLSASLNLTAAAVIYSQLISNVPATLLLSHYSIQWKYLAWGVNIGANGLLMASFANLIGVRLSRPHKIAGRYHWYAIPFLFISILMVYLILF